MHHTSGPHVKRHGGGLRHSGRQFQRRGRQDHRSPEASAGGRHLASGAMRRRSQTWSDRRGTRRRGTLTASPPPDQAAGLEGGDGAGLALARDALRASDWRSRTPWGDSSSALLGSEFFSLKWAPGLTSGLHGGWLFCLVFLRQDFYV